MRGKRYLIMTVGGVIICALAVFLLSFGEVTALLLPVLVHELAHIAALTLCGFYIRGLRLEPGGLSIDYDGDGTYLTHGLSALAGPAAGLIYYHIVSPKGVSGSEWRELSAGISLLLSAFNLLPALPLDGGRILLSLSCVCFDERVGRRLTEIVGTMVGLGLLAVGTWLLLEGKGIGVELAAIWMIICGEDDVGIVLSEEIL